MLQNTRGLGGGGDVVVSETRDGNSYIGRTYTRITRNRVFCEILR